MDSSVARHCDNNQLGNMLMISESMELVAALTLINNVTILKQVTK